MKQLYRTVDMHTAGEPVRIVTEGYPALAGATLLERRRDARARFDHIRRTLMLEPRGHAGMYGVIPLPPSAPGAELAVLFTHNEGYSTMCGHATIAVGRWAVESGRVGGCRFGLETPCGVVRVDVAADGSVAFDSVPSFASHLDRRITLPGRGEVAYDIAFGGAYYAILPASRLGLDLAAAPLAELVAAGVELTEAVRASVPIRHPSEPDLGFLYGTIITDETPPDAARPSWNLCIFAEGQIDRSPTGSGVTARMALDWARGRMAQGRRREFRGISGGAFTGEIVAVEGESVRVRVGGTAHYTGEACFTVEPGDPLGHGFVLPARFGDIMG
ncbi:MAG TPA: proline racemase family protein [Aliidongia sp.]|nr:proline racemase family protein [Aliidongia sp.]